LVWLSGRGTPRGGVGSGWVVGFQVGARYWVLRLHGMPAGWGLFLGGWVCVAGPPCGSWAWWLGGRGVGLWVENCIVDASIL
jgi:hypothetical protein